MVTHLDAFFMGVLMAASDLSCNFFLYPNLSIRTLCSFLFKDKKEYTVVNSKRENLYHCAPLVSLLNVSGKLKEHDGTFTRGEG